jgi:hypothetical protein
MILKEMSHNNNCEFNKTTTGDNFIYVVPYNK